MFCVVGSVVAICVRTPVGNTEECDTGDGIGQGTLEGALVIAVSLDTDMLSLSSSPSSTKMKLLVE